VAARGTVLLVEDEERIRKTLGRALREDGHEVVTASRAEEAEPLLQARSFDLLVVDNVLPGRSGLELVRSLTASTAEGERPQILMMTAHATVENAIEAMKLGAFDYLQKPFEIDQLLVVARRAVEHQRLRTEHLYLRRERDEDFGSYGLVGRSRAIQELTATIALVARSRSTVLVSGETGTGKELVARAVHHRSAERDMPLIKVNCAAIPEALLESEMFGHVRGAFTGATATKKGKFALADGGTIFLDEIGTMSPALQAKLLRVVQEREFEPLGSERSQRVDVRIIAATNRDLRRMVGEGRFLEDLYYRLSVIPLTIPTLRERKEDVPLLVEHFVAKHAQRLGKRIERVDDEALAALAAYDWPGNVRELENAVERAVVLATRSSVGLAEIVLVGAPSAGGPGLPSTRIRDNVEWAERESIRRALERTGGHKKEAAAVLGISQRALSYYLGKHGIE
jgi:two-component system, NtrC family, response regulator AtoC